MTEQHPDHNPEQYPSPEAARIAALEAELADVQQQRREAEHLRSKLLLWRAMEQKVLTHSIDGRNTSGAKRLFQLPNGDYLELLGTHPTEKWRLEYPGEYADDPDESHWTWEGNILRPGQYAVSSDGEITPPEIDDVIKSSFTLWNDSDGFDVSMLPEGADDTHLLDMHGVGALRNLVEISEPLGPTVYRYDD